ncbi:Dual specificity tyrosine-phosphorylation-regulated kinase mbk-2 [Orchesella cincta]|uniref:Dual specificity tyrosine-phosphorylation-regulated kinase mbk-2 n=1 Tax=Orchesella cincta TaxID=48709 RepID=A0A1D2M3F7_ORCCI|nr:Dual specificity tyrosine-phosphorylation-regulated kinase mbk-2 [Orchesella cincta]
MSKTGKEAPCSSKASAGSPTSMYSELATQMSVLDSLAKMSLDWKPTSSEVEPEATSSKTSMLLETSTNSTPFTPTKALQPPRDSRLPRHLLFGKDHQRKLLPRSNYGHDCRLGFYRYVVGDHIGYRYEVLEQLGKVSYAEVFKVYDHKESIIVVLKIGRSLPPYSFQVKREIGLLKRLKESNVKINVIQMIDHFCFRNHECVTFKLLPFDLIHLIKLSKGEGYHLHFVQKWILSLVTTLVELGKQKIVHGDLKGNLLLEGLDSTEVMLIDFGFASYDGQDLLPKVQALRYRAPEVLFGATKYGPPIDMWSVGVIAAELYSGDNLFTSNSETEQVAALVELLGSPPEELLKVSDPKMKSVVDSLLRKAGEAESKTFYGGTSGPRAPRRVEVLQWQSVPGFCSQMSRLESRR